MIFRKWEDLPEKLKTPEVKPYYDMLSKKRASLVCKRIFDIIVSAVMLIILSPLFLILSIVIKLDSKGPVFFRQVRITQYGREFRIHKFRTMVCGADKMGTQVTAGNDPRITKVGAMLRGCRLDEIPQLIDILSGNMSFVGTRPEVPKYVDSYTDEMMATLLLPAGVTSEASILYKDEAALLDNADDVDTVYIGNVLPNKMRYNLKEIENYSFWRDIRIMFMTFFAMCGKKYEEMK